MCRCLRAFLRRLRHRKKKEAAKIEERRVSKEEKGEPEEEKVRGYRRIFRQPPLRNAPRYQPCPKCQKWVKRTHRGPRLAKYYCRKCRVELVVNL